MSTIEKEEEGLDGISLTEFVEAIKKVIPSELSFLKNNDWLQEEKLEDVERKYRGDLAVVSNAMDSLKQMSKIKNARTTKLYETWYTKLVEFQEIHEKRGDAFLKKSENLDVYDNLPSLLDFRRLLAKNMSTYSLIKNNSKPTSHVQELTFPRLKNDTPISIVMKDSIEKHFPHLATIVEQKKEKWKKENS